MNAAVLLRAAEHLLELGERTLAVELLHFVNERSAPVAAPSKPAPVTRPTPPARPQLPRVTGG